jgi:hypothetical protein
MNQIIQTFCLTASTSNCDSMHKVARELADRITKYAREKRYEIVSISHFANYFKSDMAWGGNAIVVFKAIPDETSSITLLDFDE